MLGLASGGRRWAVLAALLPIAAGCSGGSAQHALALTVALPPGTSGAQVAAAAPLATQLSKATGATVHLVAPASTAELVAGIKKGRIDAALLPDRPYADVARATSVHVVAQAAAQPVAPVLLCSGASGVQTLNDGTPWSSLHQKAVLLGPGDSLATNIWPRSYMIRNGIDPLGDLASVRLVGDERRALLDVYNGIADCAAASSDIRSSISDLAPDAPQRLHAAFTAPVAIPPPPVIVRASLDAALQRALASGLIGVHAGTPASTALAAIIGSATARSAGDRDYAGMRSVLTGLTLPAD